MKRIKQRDIKDGRLYSPLCVNEKNAVADASPQHGAATTSFISEETF